MKRAVFRDFLIKYSVEQRDRVRLQASAFQADPEN